MTTTPGPLRPSAALRAAAASLLALGAAGCGPRHRVDNYVWTLFDLQQKLQHGEGYGGPPLPEGMSVSSLLKQDGTATVLSVTPAFAEGAPAAYVTTDIWINYAEDNIWPQPLYFQMVDDTTPLRDANGADAPALVDVGPESTFYSPFWSVSRARVGPLDDVNHYRSTRDLLDQHVPLVRDGLYAAPLRPLDLLAAAAGRSLTEPTWGTPLDAVEAEPAWLNGTSVGVLDFGEVSFWLDPDEGYVQPLPTFVFYARDASGAAAPVANALPVRGSVMLLSGATAEVGVDEATGWPMPKFGAFARLYHAVLPAGAGPFAAAANPTAAARAADPKDYEGRVALDTRCFGDSGFPGSCQWLDSQASIEAALPNDDLVPTNVLATSPLVFYDKKPVKL
jgi:hypothetical protein